MLRKLLGTILIILGLAAAGLGVASATVWREPDSVVSTATPQGDGTLVVTDPGVLELVGTDVTVVATVPGDGEVTVAIGRDIDVEGWVGIDHSTRVHGLADWDRLTTSAVEPDLPEVAEDEEPPTPGVGADPAGNDMWVAEATGEGSVSLRWTDRPGRWSLIAAGVGEDAQAPTVELTWPRTATTPWLWPGVGVGAALLVAGLLVLLVRRKPRAIAPGDGAPVAPTQDPTRSEGTTTPGDAGLSDAAASGAGPSLAGRWPAPPNTSAGTTDAGTTDAGTTDAGTTDAGTPGVGDQPEDAGTTGAEGGEAERPARPALISRRARRRAAQEPQGDAAATNGEVTDPEPTDRAAPEAGPVQPATPPEKPTGRGWAFSPVFGGSSTPAPAPSSPASSPASPSSAQQVPTPPEQPQTPEQPPTPPMRRQALSRRQMLKSQPAPSPQPAPSNPTPEPAAPAAPDPATTTGSMPRLTRRELRAQEEARRAAGQTGITGRLRALTGTVPVVRPTPPVPPAHDPAAPPSRASRSQAWREAWGFDPDGSRGTDDDTEGGAR